MYVWYFFVLNTTYVSSFNEYRLSCVLPPKHSNWIICMSVCVYVCIYAYIDGHIFLPQKLLFLISFYMKLLIFFNCVYDLICACVCIHIWIIIQYSFQVIPKVGELVAGDAESYQYLVESIRRFPKQVLHNLLIGTHLHQTYYIITCLSHAICVCKGFTYTYILRRNCLLWCPMQASVSFLTLT